MSAQSAVQAVTLPIPQKANGSHFYKYSEFIDDKRDWLKNMILENRLYVPRIPQLNDPADGRPKLKGMSADELFHFLYQGSVLERNPRLSVEDQIKEGLILDYNIKFHGTDVVMRGTVKSLYEELSDWRIYCLCKRSDNMSMWAKYADNHKGYCLEFANVGPFFGAAKEVTYGDQVPLDIRIREQMDGRWFFRKAQEWSGEEEVRILVPRRTPPEQLIEPEWLTRLILGWKMPEADRVEIRTWAKQRFPELKIVEASWDDVGQALGIGN